MQGLALYCATHMYWHLFQSKDRLRFSFGCKKIWTGNRIFFCRLRIKHNTMLSLGSVNIVNQTKAWLQARKSDQDLWNLRNAKRLDQQGDNPTTTWLKQFTSNIIHSLCQLSAISLTHSPLIPLGSPGQALGSHDCSNQQRTGFYHQGQYRVHRAQRTQQSQKVHLWGQRHQFPLALCCS